MAQSKFGDGGIERIARTIGDAFVGGTIDQMLSKAGVTPSGGSTRWRRIDASLRQAQNQSGCGNPVTAFIRQAVDPQRWVGQTAELDGLRCALNDILIYDGIKIRTDGDLVLTKKARSHDEAAAMSRRLRDGVISRGGHAEVHKYCSVELVKGDAYNALFEAVKGLAERVRDMTGLDRDGHGLVAGALEGANPHIALNARRTTTEKNQQLGVASLIKGLFSAFRNPAAHEPRILWSVSEADALDVSGREEHVNRKSR